MNLPQVNLGDLQWGTVGDWASSSVALVAIFATLVMWRRDNASLVREREQRLEDEAVDRAALVGCWVETLQMSDGPSVVSFVVENRGVGPIFEWNAEVFVDPPARDYIFGSSQDGVIPPHGGRKVIPLVDASGQALLRSSVTFEYVLGNGSRWVRSPTGELSRVGG